jgi:hypothetical protein
MVIVKNVKTILGKCLIMIQGYILSFPSFLFNQKISIALPLSGRCIWNVGHFWEPGACVYLITASNRYRSPLLLFSHSNVFHWGTLNFFPLVRMEHEIKRSPWFSLLTWVDFTKKKNSRIHKKIEGCNTVFRTNTGSAYQLQRHQYIGKAE